MHPIRSSWLAAAALVLALGGCAPLVTQSPGGKYSPVNAVSEGGDDRLLLRGADVVAYHTQGRYVQGSAEFRSTYEGVTLRFASADHKQAFEREPARYLPQFGGYCANGIAYGIPWGGDADTWRIIDGKLYIFGGAGSRDAFMLDPARNVGLAQKYWSDEVSGSNALLQRVKRMVFRVPHYKSGEELAAEVAAAAAKTGR
jgi:YHS domain-containing protein